MPEVIVAVTAHNEEATIATTLSSLQRSIRHAEARTTTTFDLVAVLDRCTDRTESIASEMPGVRLLIVSGGLIEAQRAVVESAGAVDHDFVMFCDADVEVGDSTVLDLVEAMQADPKLKVAYAASVPNRPSRSTLLANALHTYNANDGFEIARHYFSGRCFAIRGWRVPRRIDLQERLDGIDPDPFFRFHDGLVADDVFLSKSIVHRQGERAIRRVSSATVRFQPPETLGGMHRYGRRMRAEIHRVDRLFPEFARDDVPAVGRRLDRSRLAAASRRQQLHWLVFQLASRWCRLRYFVERPYYRYLSKEPCPLWPTVTESKSLVSNG